jgi:hypothetical protein
MEFVTKKTIELTQEEKKQIAKLFEEVFELPYSPEFFEKSYVCNYLGYSYHTLFKDNEVVVGVNSMVPIEYEVNGKIMPFVNSGGTMIAKSHRGIDNFCDLIDESYDYIEKEGYKAYVGFPNDNSYPLYIGMGIMEDIGRMYTYMLPFRVGGVKKKLAMLNPLSKLLCRCYIMVNGWMSSKEVAQFKIRKDHTSFDEYRYKKNEGAYGEIAVGNGKAYYRVMNHDGVRTAFIVDVTEKTARNFCKVCTEIWKREKNNIDLILYVGNLPFKHHGMIKVPRKFEPKNFNFTGHIFNEKAIDKGVFYEFGSWDVNLSNYDLI